jgi:hypothetical protein
MSPVFLVPLVACAFAASWYFSDIRRLTRDYPCREPFDGTLVRCNVRFVLVDYFADCALGANNRGLYIASAVGPFPRKPWWSGASVWGGGYIVKTPMFIPWSCLRYGDAAAPLGRSIRFDVPSLRIGLSAVCFFVPRETGEQLLRAAGRA